MRVNLVPAIKAIKDQIRQIQHKHRKELEPYEESLDAMRKVNTACEQCEGTGRVFSRSCAEDDGDYHTCTSCWGTGVQKKA